VPDYKNVKELIDPLSAKIPVAFAMGNHDRHEPFLEVFTKTIGERQELENRYVNVLEYPSMRFVILDSLDKCPSHGFLGKAQRDWLSSYLAEHTDKPVILFVHHSFKDYDGELIDADRMFNIVKPQHLVKAVVYGHTHSYNYSVRDNIHLINLPSTAYNFRPSEPLGWIEAEFTGKGGMFKLHAIAGNMEKDGEVTELKWR
jgi:3',5'-cyclic AMP phosphodiesterase CpdA